MFLPLFVVLLICFALLATLTTGVHADDGDGFDLTAGLASPELPGQDGLTYPNLGWGLSDLADGSQYGADFLWGGGSGDGGSGNGVAASPFQPGDTGNHTASMLALSIIVDGDVGRVVDVINANGGDVRNVLGSYIEAYVPPTVLARLAQTPGVSWARELARPLQARGTVTSGGVAQHLASAWHDAGIKGQGVKIGVIDVPRGSTTRDGFTGTPALLGTDLPSAVTARCYTDLGKHTSNIADCSAAGGNNHGTIVAETVMDVAPEASLYIANPVSSADLRRTAQWMHGEGVQVIVYSITWQFHGPPDGTSPYPYGPLNTVKWAADNGIVWVNAAGNRHRDTWYGPFADADTDNIHEWRAGTENQYLTLGPGKSVRVFMRWDDTWEGADDDLALMVVTKPGSPDEAVLATANDSQTGDSHHEPFENVTIENTGSQSATVALRVKSMDGSKPSWIQLVAWGGVLGTQSDGYSVMSPADSPHPGMLAVGAGSPIAIHNYSSRGPTPDGRVKPDIVGAAGMQTAADGTFWGTSAATPHVGGLAALVVQQNPSFAPTEVTGYLKAHAIANGPIVPNSTWGHGFAQLPSPSCAEDLNGSGTTSGSWTNGCVSAADSAKSGRYYNIRVLQESTVAIDLSSSVDSYLRLRNGYNAQQGTALHSDDNGGTGNNARISATLAAGSYTIEATTAANSQTGAFSLDINGLAAVPVVSLSGGADVTEGSNVRFTLTASPIPSSPMPVKVQVSVTGDYGVTPSTRTINIPTSTGSTQLVLSTANDNVPEANGGITAMLVKGASYDVSSSASAATVGVNDNDNFSCHDLVTADGSVDGILVTNCKQSFYSEDSKRYARFYSFEIAQRSGVVIEMESTELNPYLMLRHGKDARTGTPLHFNDNAGESQNPPGTALYLNARISEALSAGWYTIEATSLDHEETGSFKMQIRGLSPQTSVPVISIADGGDITEGEDASFTLTASPAPAADLDVTVAVTQDGDFATTGSQTVTIPATGSATLTVYTDNDSVAESDGSITAAIRDGNGYAVSSTISVSERTGAGIATVNVADDDGGLACTTTLTTDGEVSGTWADDCNSQQRPGRNARYYIFELEQSSNVTIELTSSADTYMFLLSGENTQSGQPLYKNDDVGGGNLNSRISETLAAGWYTIEATTYASGITRDFSLTITGLASQPTEPEISIAGGGGVTEGAAASFTVTAAPAPGADLDVTVSVSQSGDYGATTGSRTVTIPASGSETFAVATADDSADEADGSVTATVGSGTGYTVSSGSGSATVAVADNDVPEISIAGGGGVTEGVAASFTVTAAPSPAAGLDVTVSVSQSGDYGATTGSRTVTIPASGSETFTVATADDSADEADGSVTATVGSGSGYTVSSTQGAATVAVSDDDDPLPVVSIVGGSAVTEGGNATYTLTASPAPAAPLTVNVTVSQSGDFYVGTGPAIVQIATSGTHILRLGTSDDSIDEADGSVTVSLSAGTGYTVSSTQGAASVAVSDDDVPEVSIAAGSGVSEGTAASFTLTASPKPAAGLDVTVAVSQSGDFGAATGSRTVTVPASGSFTLSVATANDTTDEADGSVTATVSTGTGYTVSSSLGSASVAVSDDDPAECAPQLPDDAVTVDEVTGWRDGLSAAAAAGVKRFNRVLAALGVDTGDTPMTAEQAQGVADWLGNSRWDRISRTLAAVEQVQCGDDAEQDDPEISIAGGAGVVEGVAASFTVTASPKPAVDLDVTVIVAQSGDFGVSAGSRAVTIPASGSKAFTVATVDDSVDEADGSVTVSVGSGTGYAVSSSAGSASVAVSDDDVPEVSIAAGSGVVEGSAASFTLTASPKPAVGLDVAVAVSQSGDFGVVTGSRTVAVPASGSATFTVATSGDSDDEADGSVTVSVGSGTGYTVSSSAGSTSVAVSDDDVPLVVADVCVSALEGDGSVAGQWTDACDSEGREGRYARFFTFSLAQRATVTIDLESSVDTYLFLRSGLGRDGGELSRNDDGGDGYNSRISESLAAGDYTVEATTFSRSTTGAFTLSVDGLTAQPPPAVLPEISIAAGSGVTEGGAASFTLTASPAPTAALTVGVTVSQSGDFGVTTGARTVTVPTSGSYTLTVATAGDSADEADGSVIVSIDAGTGYTVSTSSGSATVAVFDDDDPPPPPPDPQISIAAGSGVTEGGAASFTLTASPVPQSALTVGVSVAQSGDFGVATGARTVTISTSGSYALIVATTGDSVDEADGSVTVSVSSGTGYTVSSGNSSATVAVSDDDPPPPPPPPADCVSDETLGLARDYYELNRDRAPGYGRNWLRVLVAFGDVVDDQVTAFTAAEALEREQLWFGWRPFREALECIEAAQQPASPQISIAAGSGVTEGSAASFTLTASPAPAAALTVDVTVSQSGDFGVATGSRTVTISTAGIFALSVDTTGDSADEADGSVTVTIDTGTGYTVSSSAGSATVAVSDDDDPAPPPPPPAEPEISIAAGSDVTEGTAATFTLTASSQPASALSVSVTVAQSGSFGVSTGARTVTIPTGGSYTLTVATTDDTTDEADGSVTATVGSGTGYTVSSSDSSATVAVADDDVPEISIAAGSGVTEGSAATFTVTASPVPAASLDVSVTVSQSGDFASIGEQTVTIPTTGSATFTVATTDDTTDEADGSVTATVGSGTGYTVSSTQSAATVAVSDDDDAAPPPNTPVISIVGGTAVTEGGDATFTITASPAPTAPLTVSLTVSQSGNYYLLPGTTTIQMASSGTYTLRLGTRDDSTDEPDGSLTVTVDSGTGYTVSSAQGAATVAVSDNDLPSSGPPTVIVSDATAVEGAQSLVFVVTLSKPNPDPITFRYGGYARTATLWQDWTIEYKAFTLDAGDTTIDLTVPVIDDDTPENDETLRIYVYAISGIVIRDGFLYATGTITDDD
ncbi:hypothetical protein [Candidatus Poriferisocius sp.]|uniref:hypothetical protein n=1 Tax=Candidatus Poriferisocius sp. TaxID=3101276 RepID=UPI003B52C053